MPLHICFRRNFGKRSWMKTNDFLSSFLFCPKQQNVAAFLWATQYKRVRTRRYLDSYKPLLRSSISPTLVVCCFCNCQTALLLSLRKLERLHDCAQRKGLVHILCPLYFVPLSHAVPKFFAC